MRLLKFFKSFCQSTDPQAVDQAGRRALVVELQVSIEPHFLLLPFERTLANVHMWKINSGITPPPHPRIHTEEQQ